MDTLALMTETPNKVREVTAINEITKLYLEKSDQGEAEGTKFKVKDGMIQKIVTLFIKLVNAQRCDLPVENKDISGCATFFTIFKAIIKRYFPDEDDYEKFSLNVCSQYEKIQRAKTDEDRKKLSKELGSGYKTAMSEMLVEVVFIQITIDTLSITSENKNTIFDNAFLPPQYIFSIFANLSFYGLILLGGQKVEDVATYYKLFTTKIVFHCTGEAGMEEYFKDKDLNAFAVNKLKKGWKITPEVFKAMYYKARLDMATRRVLNNIDNKKPIIWYSSFAAPASSKTQNTSDTSNDDTSENKNNNNNNSSGKTTTDTTNNNIINNSSNNISTDSEEKGGKQEQRLRAVLAAKKELEQRHEELLKQYTEAANQPFRGGGRGQGSRGTYRGGFGGKYQNHNNHHHQSSYHNNSDFNHHHHHQRHHQQHNNYYDQNKDGFHSSFHNRGGGGGRGRGFGGGGNPHSNKGGFNRGAGRARGRY